MTAQEINIVKNSWQRVAQMDPVTVGDLFYGRLFEIAPQLKPLFRYAHMPEQSRKLLTMIHYVIAKLDRLDEIIDEVGKLARRHVQYGVRPEDYAPVGAALLWTLETGLGSHWNQELAEAWTKCYQVLTSAMISASDYTEQSAA